MRAIGGWVEPNFPDPGIYNSGVLPGRQMWRHMQSTGKQKVLRIEARAINPRCQHLPCLLCDLKLNRTLGFLLHDNRPSSNPVTVRYVTHSKTNQITRPQLAIDSQIEQCKIADAICDLKPYTYCPDVLQ